MLFFKVVFDLFASILLIQKRMSQLSDAAASRNHSNDPSHAHTPTPCAPQTPSQLGTYARSVSETSNATALGVLETNVLNAGGVGVGGQGLALGALEGDAHMARFDTRQLLATSVHKVHAIKGNFYAPP